MRRLSLDKELTDEAKLWCLHVVAPTNELHSDSLAWKGIAWNMFLYKQVGIEFHVSEPECNQINTIPTSQRPHFTGDGHTKPILNEVKDQALLGLWTCRDLV